MFSAGHESFCFLQTKKYFRFQRVSICARQLIAYSTAGCLLATTHAAHLLHSLCRGEKSCHIGRQPQKFWKQSRTVTREAVPGTHTSPSKKKNKKKIQRWNFKSFLPWAKPSSWTQQGSQFRAAFLYIYHYYNACTNWVSQDLHKQTTFLVQASGPLPIWWFLTAALQVYQHK